MSDGREVPSDQAFREGLFLMIELAARALPTGGRALRGEVARMAQVLERRSRTPEHRRGLGWEHVYREAAGRLRELLKASSSSAETARSLPRDWLQETLAARGFSPDQEAALARKPLVAVRRRLSRLHRRALLRQVAGAGRRHLATAKAPRRQASDWLGWSARIQTWRGYEAPRSANAGPLAR